MKKILLFDIDGTLLLTGGAGKIAFERAFSECFGIKDSWGNTRPDGKTDPVIFQEIALSVLGRPMKEAEYKRFSELYLAYFPLALEKAPRFRLMPGVETILENLACREDILLGTATGNFEDSAWAKLERASLGHYFKFGAYGSDSDNRNEIVQTAKIRAQDLCMTEDAIAGDTWVIGDTPQDIASGKANHARTVAVATGRYSLGVLKEHDPDFAFEDLSDARDFLSIFS